MIWGFPVLQDCLEPFYLCVSFVLKRGRSDLCPLDFFFDRFFAGSIYYFAEFCRKGVLSLGDVVFTCIG